MPENKKLSTSRRLKHRQEFQRFFQSGEVLRLRTCTVFRVEGARTREPFRLGITLKARGSSVERNRVRRKVREAMRQQPEVLSGYDYNVVIGRGKTMTSKYSQHLYQELSKKIRGGKFRKAESAQVRK